MGNAQAHSIYKVCVFVFATYIINISSSKTSQVKSKTYSYEIVVPTPVSPATLVTSKTFDSHTSPFKIFLFPLKITLASPSVPFILNLTSATPLNWFTSPSHLTCGSMWIPPPSRWATWSSWRRWKIIYKDSVLFENDCKQTSLGKMESVMGGSCMGVWTMERRLCVY
jgi:hypothetical protein